MPDVKKADEYREPEDEGRIIKISPPPNVPREKVLERRQVWQGLQIIIGPVGSGKTLLTTGLVWKHCFDPRYRCLGRSCGDKDCQQDWTVMTNLEGLVGPKWERDGDPVVHGLSLDRLGEKHYLLLIDVMAGWPLGSTGRSKDQELQSAQLINGMGLPGVKVYLTSPNLSGAYDYYVPDDASNEEGGKQLCTPIPNVAHLDMRVRGRTRRFFSVWNPKDDGSEIHALIVETGVGRGPFINPQFIPQVIRAFDTSPYLELYDTLEVPRVVG